MARPSPARPRSRSTPPRIALPELRESRAPGPLALGVRPEQIVIGDPGRQGSALPAEIFGAEYLGTTQIVTLTTPRGTLKARLPAHVPAAAGDRVSLSFKPERLVAVRCGDGQGDPLRAA